jgi:hypothetical protein
VERAAIITRHVIDGAGRVKPPDKRWGVSMVAVYTARIGNNLAASGKEGGQGDAACFKIVGGEPYVIWLSDGLRPALRDRR